MSGYSFSQCLACPGQSNAYFTVQTISKKEQGESPLYYRVDPFHAEKEKATSNNGNKSNAKRNMREANNDLDLDDESVHQISKIRRVSKASTDM